MGDTINWGIFKRHFWGELLRHQHDAANATLTAVGYNFRLVLAWLRMLLRLILTALLQSFTIPPTLKSAC